MEAHPAADATSEEQASAEAVLVAFDPATVGGCCNESRAADVVSNTFRRSAPTSPKVTHGGTNPSASQLAAEIQTFRNSFKTCDPVVDRRFHEQRRSITWDPLRSR
jgi:hypothetical protein